MCHEAPTCYGRDMAKSQSNGGTVDVDGAKYDWHLQREPRQSDDEGWKGLAISVVQRGAKREAWVEFPRQRDSVHDSQ